MTSVLYLLRHADAMPSVPGGRDRDRPLSEHGAKQAKRVAAKLGGLLAGDKVELALCSPAIRTRQTLEAITAAGLVSGPVDTVDAIFDAGSDTLVELLSLVEESSRTVLVVGHAPGVPALCWELADAAGSAPEALAALERGFPAATLARVELDVGWPDVRAGAGRLTDVVVTR